MANDLSLYAKQLVAKAQVPEVLAGSRQARIDTICTDLRDDTEFMRHYSGISVRSYGTGVAAFDDLRCVDLVKKDAKKREWQDIATMSERDVNYCIYDYRRRLGETRKERRAAAREVRAASFDAGTRMND